MADHSLDALLRWMAAANSNALQGWDAIAALERDKLNTLLEQIYVAGHAGHSYLPAMNGEYPLSGGSAKEVCHQVTLGAPRLSFENTGLNDARARLTFALVGGLSLTMHKNGSLWQVATINLMSPLQGPHLHLELVLDRVPVTVGEQGQVVFDLRNSDNFQLDNGDTPENQERGGEFFRQLFRNLPDEQRVFVLGVIEPGDQPVMRPHSFRLLTQRREASGEAGAVLILISMRAGRNGQALPASHPWLIPDTAAVAYSASVLINRQRVLAGAVMSMLSKLINGQHFTYAYDTNGQVRSARSTAGGFVAPPAQEQITTLPGQTGETLPVFVRTGKLVMSAAAPQPLQVEFANDTASVNWNAAGELDLTIVLGTAELPLHVTCTMELEAAYELSQSRQTLIRNRYSLLVVLLPPPPPEGAGLQGDGSDMARIILYWALIWAALALIVPNIVVEKVIQAQVSESFDAEPVMDAFIQQTLKLNFAHAIEAASLYLPRDLLATGRINPRLSSFNITPVLPTVLAGTSLQFFAAPAQTGMQWQVEALSGGDQAAGTIERYGRYTAAPASVLDRPWVEVRVTATNSQGHQGVALVRVVRSNIVLGPLIQVCQAGKRTELQGSVSGGGMLLWDVRSLRDTPPGTLQGQGETGTYSAPSASALGNSYGLDEITLRPVGSEGVKAWVLVNYGSPVTVRLAGDPPPAGGPVQLQAMAGTTQLEVTEWLLPLGGPGTIDEQGRYTPDPQSDAQFVLVLCKAMVSVLVFEGALILPLPLGRFAL